MDMSTSYIKGATQHFPQASIVFDKFHVMVLAGKALEEVRLQLQREGAQLKGVMWSLRGNVWNLSPERQAQRKDLCRQYTQLGRAMSLRETLQAIYANSDRQTCDWCRRPVYLPFAIGQRCQSFGFYFWRVPSP
jgi:transposase